MRSRKAELSEVEKQFESWEVEATRTFDPGGVVECGGGAAGSVYAERGLPSSPLEFGAIQEGPKDSWSGCERQTSQGRTTKESLLVHPFRQIGLRGRDPSYHR